MPLNDLVTQVKAVGRAKDETYVNGLFTDFLAKVLVIDGHDVNGNVTGFGRTLTHAQVFDALRLNIIAVRATWAEDREVARIDQILREALKG